MNYIRTIALLLFFLNTLQANNEVVRENFPEAWKKTNIKETLLALYGKEIKVETNATLKLSFPKIIENGSVIPISIKSDIPLKSLVIMQEILHNKTLIAFIQLPYAQKIDYKLRVRLGRNFRGKLIVVGQGGNGNFYESSNKIHANISCCMGDCESFNKVKFYSKAQINTKVQELKKLKKYKLKTLRDNKIGFLTNLQSFDYKTAKSYGLPAQFPTHLQLSQENQPIINLYLSEYISRSLFFAFSEKMIDKGEPIEIFIENINGQIIETQAKINKGGHSF